jgi:hypothetical protein
MQALFILPLLMSAFAMAISLLAALCSGFIMAVDFIMLSDVHAIIFIADAGPAATTESMAAAINILICPSLENETSRMLAHGIRILCLKRFVQKTDFLLRRSAGGGRERLLRVRIDQDTCLARKAPIASAISLAWVSSAK